MATNAPFDVFGTTPVWRLSDGHFLWVCGYDIDGDGGGGNKENDPDFQDDTTYQPRLNSRTVRFGVVPMRLRRNAPGIVIGCRMQYTYIPTGKTLEFVAGDEGPDDKIGEGSICGADAFGIPSDPNTGGTQEPLFLVKIWPDVPAVVDDVTYKLQPYRP